MKRDYILIDNKKLNIPNWGKWIILLLICNITIVIVHTAMITVGENIGIDLIIMRQVAYYIEIFSILTFIHDLVPTSKIKEGFSIYYSFLAILCYLAEYDMQASLPDIIFIAMIIFYRILLYKKFT